MAVPPLIRTENPSVGVANGSSVVLECIVEAFPESLCYWERADGRSIDSVHKAFLRDHGKYKVMLTLYLEVEGASNSLKTSTLPRALELINMGVWFTDDKVCGDSEEFLAALPLFPDVFH